MSQCHVNKHIQLLLNHIYLHFNLHTQVNLKILTMSQYEFVKSLPPALHLRH